ncbi:exonuclease domain-containing protein [Streptomyces sp. CA-111067]|uniref:exonuclease domain-containing protein n=1 Tax=Streptomyces sp. CA-111067 TaxID=3240046 RepID=UPI003D954E3C
MSAPWFLQRMAGLDFESSDKHPQTARIVTCALILVGGGQAPSTRTWLLSPGIPMEAEAISVHGITDEYAAEHGIPAEQGVGEIAQALMEVVTAGVPLVGHNLGGYDLNLLNAECARHLGDTLEGIVRQPLTRVIDTMVLDKHAAPYRKRVSETQGAYQMRTTAEAYGLGWDEDQAHGAEYDALMSARAAYRMGAIAFTPRADRPAWVQSLRNRRGPYERFDDLAVTDVEELHRRQVVWAREQGESYQVYLRARGEHAQADGVSTQWPLEQAEDVPAAEGAGA